MLTSKGLNENDVRQRLQAKGIDIDKLSIEDLIKNKALIEQTIAEMEAEKKSLTTIQRSAVNNNVMPVTVSKQEQAVEKEQKKFISTLLPSTIYGHNIFRDSSIAIYRVSKDASPPESYILAPGDKINILIFGRSQADLQYEINASGFIQPAQMPKIFLNGLTLKQAKELLATRFSAYYVFAKEQFALTLNTSRTLNVNIFGEIEKAGSFTTSALNTALNVLSASGGPTEIGSIRNIQIIRGSTKKILDVYAFMRNPILQFDFFLQNNDIIYVPRAELIVSVEGSVNRPMNYELKVGETLKDLIDYAGGLKADTYTDLVQLERFENNEVVLKDYNLQEILQGKLKVSFKNGDIIRLKTINSPLKQFIKINGSVEYPGTYDLTTTSAISTLLEKAKLKPDAKFGYIYRSSFSNPKKTEYFPFELDGLNNLVLEPNDNIVILNKEVYALESQVSIAGEVKNPLQLRYDNTLSLKDLVKLAGGLKIAADLSGLDVFRLNFQGNETPTRTVLTITIDKEFNPLAPNQDFQLQPYDLVVVRQIPEFSLQETIQINGEVKHPGVYVLKSRNYRFSDLISDADGLNVSADVSNTTLIRYESGAGLLVFDADMALNNKGKARFDPLLVPGDLITVPKLDNSVFIDPRGTNYDLGENQKSLQIVYQGTNSAAWYIRNFAGGFAQKADKNSVKVIRENGLVVRTNKALGIFRNYPTVKYGDRIQLTLKVDKDQNQAANSKPFDWDKFLTKVISVATVFALITSATK
ncbi:MAG: SLBB domain-containing protein [Sphingobacteriaceae bacterium]